MLKYCEGEICQVMPILLLLYPLFFCKFIASVQHNYFGLKITTNNQHGTKNTSIPLTFDNRNVMGIKAQTKLCVPKQFTDYFSPEFIGLMLQSFTLSFKQHTDIQISDALIYIVDFLQCIVQKYFYSVYCPMTMYSSVVQLLLE